MTALPGATSRFCATDGPTTDLGYPVATEAEPGRIFTAYYFTMDDGNGFGGTRYIAGSSFRLG